MSDNIEFVQGLIFKAPHERAPEFVKAKGSIKVADLRAWLDTKKESEWVNFDQKVPTGGKWIATVDNWQPESKGRGTSRQAPNPTKRPSEDDPFPDEDIPFATNRGKF